MTGDYRMILACRLSGQIDDARWQKHLADPVFAEWLGVQAGGPGR